MSISAAQVKELRERTGAGMMDCKKALEKSAGDMDGAIEELRKAGVTKAGKIGTRIATEGAVIIVENANQAAMVEVNSETDFVARDPNFSAFANALAKSVLKHQQQDVATFMTMPLEGSEE